MSGTEEYDPAYAEWESKSYPPDWQARRKKVLNRDNYRCQDCGVRSTRVDSIVLDVDHIVPKSEGGGHGLDNLQTLCAECHANKHPNNMKLHDRGRSHRKRNKPNILIRVLLSLLSLVLGIDRKGEYDHANRELTIEPLEEIPHQLEGEGVTVEAVVDELWDPNHENMQQVGLLKRDGTTVKFTVWVDNGVPILNESCEYRFVGARTESYNGEMNLVFDQFTAVQRL